VSRRVNLPGADELFKATQPPTPSALQRVADDEPRRSPSARVRHDEKITVYVTADELLDLEHTRLNLRRAHGLAVDRGRIVRAAISLALEAVEVDGDDSALVRRLREQ